MPRDLAWSRDGDALELRFFLTAGAFATALLRELVGRREPSSADDDLA
jgi:tRNA(Glu) U13 pseudouridine synthase TruD